jgi:hypothetical protein
MSVARTADSPALAAILNARSKPALFCSAVSEGSVHGYSTELLSDNSGSVTPQLFSSPHGAFADHQPPQPPLGKDGVSM